jgi:hypothetical protein
MRHDPTASPDFDANPRELSDDELVQIRNTLRGLRFGSVQIIVQDGVIIQIERTEKRRMRTRRGHQDA